MTKLSAEFIALHGRRSSLVLELAPGEAPLWRHWGARLPDGIDAGAALRDTRALPTFALDQDLPLTVAPVFGTGWFGQSALLAHREGRDFAQGWTGCTVEWTAPGRALTLHLTDAVARLRLDLSIALDADSDVLVLRSTLHNDGDTALDLQWLAAGTLPLPGRCDAVRSFAGQHVHEFLPQTDPLTRSLWRKESRRGRTSHDCFPGAVVTTPGATAQTGRVFGAHLAWSGNHQQTIEWLHDGQYQWQFGEWLAPGEGRLAPGASLTTPELVASCSDEGLDGLAANFHAELRRRLDWPGGAMRPRPVHLNTWEGVYFDVHPGPVKEMATAAAALGIERFVLDDGWFHGRHHDRAALGDWWPDAHKFPDGLGGLIAHVNALGMEFGLWVEPEMVSPDSELFHAHPDWALQIAGRPLLTARNQLVLDIARPEASDYLFEKIAALLAAHPIRYLKWDLNRDLAPAGLGDGRAGYRAQVLAAYALMARLRAAFPEVEIESCSGGGGRIDFGVLRHAHRVWTSDCIDALSRVEMQRGFLQFFPPEIMGAHVGTAPAHTTGRTQAMAFRAAVALAGHFGVELDPRQLSTEDADELRGWIALHQQLRDRLHHGRVWRGEAGDGLHWQFHADADTADGVLIVLRTRPSDHRQPPALRLPMLDVAARYRVRELRPAGSPRREGRHHTAPFFDAQDSAEGVTLAGAWLAEVGLPMLRAPAETAFIARIERV